MLPSIRPAVSLLLLPFAIACTSHTSREEDEPAEALEAEIVEPAPVEAEAVEPVPPPIEPAPAEAPTVQADATEPEIDAATPPRPRGRDRFPRNLYMAHTEPDTGWVVDIIDLYGKDSDRVIAALRLDEQTSPEGVTLEPGGPGLPRGWKVRDTWTLVTRDGVIRRDAVRYGIEQGAGEIHVRVELARPKSRSRTPALAIRGNDVPDDLVFAKPAPRDATELGDDGIERVRSTIVSALTNRDMKKLFQRARIETKHVQIYDARLPAPLKSVVFLDAPSRAWGEPARASAMLFLAEDGTLRHFSIPDVEGGTMKARAILDVDGNGIDEIFYEDAYYEGAYEMLVWFDGDKPKERTLTGDGA